MHKAATLLHKLLFFFCINDFQVVLFYSITKIYRFKTRKTKIEEITFTINPIIHIPTLTFYSHNSELC